VAAALATVATGDDFGGSIRIPSSCCGVVGLRPSPGRVAQEIPDPTGLNSRGPIARSVRDVRLLYRVMAAVEAAPAPAPERRRRVAMADASPLGVHPACQAACRRAADLLAAAGHEIQAISWEPMAVAEGYRVVRPVTMAGVPGQPEEYGDAVRGLIREGREIGAADFFGAHQRASEAAWRLNQLVASQFDAILTPTLADPPMPIRRVPTFLGTEWDRYTAFVLPVSFSRLPAVSVPAGLHDGLPVGVQLVGRYRREWDLLALAEELEYLEGFGYRPPPGFE
jgi:amidase